MNVGDIIIKDHNHTDAQTKIKHTEIEEYVITQEDINNEIVNHFEAGKTIEEIATDFDRELTVDEIALYDSKVAEVNQQAILAELEQLDEVVSREYEDMLTAFDDLKAELQTQGITINAKPYVNQTKLEKIARKQELRNQL
jgi:2',3'-cyclic-nucleotide 2'-phosphodiesterase (5'-nucleotidase family)